MDFIKGLLQTNPTRFVAYGSAAAVWVAIQIGDAAGVELPNEVTLAVAAVATFVVTEVIRRLVYSPASVAEIIGQVPVGADAVVAEAILDGVPPAVQPKDLPGGAAE